MPAERFDFPNANGHKLAALLDRLAESHALMLCSPIASPAAKTCTRPSASRKDVTALDIAVLRFDFTGLGSSGGEFANTTFSSNVADLVAQPTSCGERDGRLRF